MSTLYFTDTSNWIFLQTSTCSLRHRFQRSAHIHPVSLVLLFLFFYSAGSTCHFIGFCLFFQALFCLVSQMIKFPACMLPLTNCLSSHLLSPKPLIKKVFAIKLRFWIHLFKMNSMTYSFYSNKVISFHIQLQTLYLVWPWKNHQYIWQTQVCDLCDQVLRALCPSICTDDWVGLVRLWFH